MRPERFEFGDRARLKGQEGPVARLVLGAQRQGSRRAVPDSMEASEKSVGQCGALMRDKVKRETHQVAVQQCDRGGPSARHQMVSAARWPCSRSFDFRAGAVSTNALAWVIRPWSLGAAPAPRAGGAFGKV